MRLTGHSLGLKVGWYDNNCICGEGSAHLNATQVAKNVAGNVKYITEAGFDGLVRFFPPFSVIFNRKMPSPRSFL